MNKDLAKEIKNTLIIGFSALFLVACTGPGLLLGAGATVGKMSLEERGIEQSGRDLLTEARLTKELANMDLGNISNISVEVMEGRALIVGRTESSQARLRAIEMLMADRHITEVYNHLETAQSLSILQKTYDATIKGKINTRLIGEEDVKSINYGFEVMDGVVYVIGIAQDEQEFKRAMQHIRDVPRVREIISYVMLKDSQERYESLQKLQAKLHDNQ